MPGRTAPSDGGPTGWERALVRSGRTTLGALYVGVALLGVLHLDVQTVLLAAPFFAAMAMVLRWQVHDASVAGNDSSISLLPAATVGALFAPFGMGVQQLGDRGAYLLLVMIGLLTVLSCHWLARLEPPTPAAVAGDRPRTSPSRPPEPAPPLPYELLRTLALDDLIDEWRRSAEQVHRTSDGDRDSAVEWRGALLQELERRDPRGFGAWVLDGTARGPEHHIRSGRDGATPRPDDSAR